jgi:hypothetical protein
MPNPWLVARNIAGLAVRRASHAAGRWSPRKRLTRSRLRAERRREQQEFIEAEARALRELEALARDSRPIVVGPWLSEVGYEALYWVPFVRWICAEHGIAPERLVAVSRGGVSSWYAGVASRYVDIFDVMPPGEFASRNRERMADEAGGQKQTGPGALDAELVRRAERALSLTGHALCHPSLMYRLFRQFWTGNRSVESVLERLRFAAPPANERMPLPCLPQRFVAVKLYTGTALPDTPANRSLLRTWVQRLADEGPVVLLDSPASLDDHADFAFTGTRVTTLGEVMTPANNLGVQTEVLRRAAGLVSTCGGLAWLAPIMGVHTSALYSDDRFLSTHLYLARQAYRRVAQPGTFAAVDVRALDALGAPARVG